MNHKLVYRLELHDPTTGRVVRFTQLRRDPTIFALTNGTNHRSLKDVEFEDCIEAQKVGNVFLTEKRNRCGKFPNYTLHPVPVNSGD